ncbi:gliding motility lipoprotein GldH [Flavobacteriaceae bacterium]|nr:gliding motility lipoprotein GldH [Flavobacteriaceae bacterium]
MERLQMNKIIYIFLIAFTISCDSNKEFDTYNTLENKVWTLDKPVVFKIPVQDSIAKFNVFLNVRNDSDYPYRNLFVISKLTLPNGAVAKDTLEYEMADAFGNWLGEGFSDVRNNKLFYLENFNFPNTGIYTFEFRQAMRKRGQISGIKELSGITEVGLRIEKIAN